ncbi:MAG: methyl-accepting chemotaxis protein [Pseudomonadales bacterium]
MGRRFTLSSKILIIPAVGAISLMISLAINTLTTQENAVLLEDAEKIQFPLLQIAEKNLVQLERIKETLQGAVTTGDEDMLDAASNMSDGLIADLGKARRIAPGLSTELSRVEEDLGAYVETAEKVTRDMIAGTADFSTLSTTITRMNQRYDAAFVGLKTFRDSRLNSFTTSMAEANTNASNAVYYGIGVGIVGILLLFGFAWPISRAIVKSMKVVVSSLRDIAEEDGDLTVRLRQTSNDEIGDLVHWFNTFADKLRHVISQIVETAGPLSGLATTLDEFVAETLKTSTAQKQRAEAVLASAGEINTSVSNVSANASDAAETAAKTANAAREGQVAIDDSVANIDALSKGIVESAGTITELDQTAKSVSLVIGVIKDIAEQTNLLALNAAIEAARAGEQGRGFAVVADEVRSLASKTQQSTDEIQATIAELEAGTQKAVRMMESSTEKTEACVASVNEAGARFLSIMENIDRNTELNTHIADATQLQQSQSEALAKHATDITNGAEQSHEATNKLATNISQLAQLSQTLKMVSDQFKV